MCTNFCSVLHINLTFFILKIHLPAFKTSHSSNGTFSFTQTIHHTAQKLIVSEAINTTTNKLLTKLLSSVFHITKYKEWILLTKFPLKIHTGKHGSPAKYFSAGCSQFFGEVTEGSSFSKTCTTRCMKIPLNFWAIS